MSCWEGKAANIVIETPIAPGYLRGIGVRKFNRLVAGKPIRPGLRAGSIALDGERELSFAEHDDVSITLETGAFRTVNVSACMQYAAKKGLMRVRA